MTKTQKWLTGLIAGMLALSFAIWTGRSLVGGASAEGAAKLMALTLPDADGKPHTLEQWRGKIIIANYWATWCPPCRDEIPSFDRLSREYSEKGVQFVGISIDSADKVREFARDYQVSYPLLVGSSETMNLAAEIGNTSHALPFTVILDRTGAIRRSKLGRLSETELKNAIRDLM